MPHPLPSPNLEACDAWLSLSQVIVGPTRLNFSLRCSEAVAEGLHAVNEFTTTTTTTLRCSLGPIDFYSFVLVASTLIPAATAAAVDGGGGGGGGGDGLGVMGERVCLCTSTYYLCTSLYWNLHHHPRFIATAIDPRGP